MPICIQSKLYICYRGEFAQNKTHIFQCFSVNDVIIKTVYRSLLFWDFEMLRILYNLGDWVTKFDMIFAVLVHCKAADAISKRLCACRVKERKEDIQTDGRTLTRTYGH